jgi:hypothetical protein
VRTGVYEGMPTPTWVRPGQVLSLVNGPKKFTAVSTRLDRDALAEEVLVQTLGIKEVGPTQVCVGLPGTDTAHWLSVDGSIFEDESNIWEVVGTDGDMTVSWLHPGRRIFNEAGGRYVITGVTDTVFLREIERGDNILSSKVYTESFSSVMAKFKPLPLELPSWLHAGVRMVNLESLRIFTVLSLSSERETLTVRDVINGGPAVSVPFVNLARSWRLAKEGIQRKTTKGTHSVSEVLLPERHIKAGNLLMRSSTRERFLILEVDYSLENGGLTLQTLEGSELKAVPESKINCLFKVVNEQFVPVDTLGRPYSERNCPECGEVGESLGVEGSYVRYRCKTHADWFYGHNGLKDGKFRAQTIFDLLSDD